MIPEAACFSQAVDRIKPAPARAHRLPYRWIVVLVLAALSLPACGERGAASAAPMPTASPASSPAPSATPRVTPSVTPTTGATLEPSLPSPAPSASPTPHGSLAYTAQSGDTLEAVARRFGVAPQAVTLQGAGRLAPGALVPAGQVLWMQLEHATPALEEPAGGPRHLQPLHLQPLHLQSLSAQTRLLPDQEIVYGPAGADFDAAAYLERTSGALGQYREWLSSSEWTGAAQVLQRVASENAINPRLLLALVEWETGCVNSSQDCPLESGYVLGVHDFLRHSLYGQLSWAAHHLAQGYYAWRQGERPPSDGLEPSLARQMQALPPELNAGSVALIYTFARLRQAQKESGVGSVHAGLAADLDPEAGFAALYRRMFGDPWQRARQAGDIFPPGVEQPALRLPFEPGWTWSFTSGPHAAWEDAGALSALDFAPPSGASGCLPSKAWITAVAAGQVVRSENGVVVLDLDGDGYEGSGWAVLYLHIAVEGRAALGSHLQAGERLGHPSCEGGPATGTHLHIARKYNGEWVAADGPLPFILDGWQAHAGEQPYQGSLTRGEETIPANVFGPRSSWIEREDQATP